MTDAKKFRSADTKNKDKVVAFSMAFEPENLLARGLGVDHLQELAVRLARPVLRNNVSIAYGGAWADNRENLLMPLLRLVNAERSDNSFADADAVSDIGILYNHVAWPLYLSITPLMEAQWIGSCRVVRITQEMAGIAPADVTPVAEAWSNTPRAAFNRAVAISAMRRMTMHPLSIHAPDAPPIPIPAMSARIVLGGKTRKYSGFMPGIWEEALLAHENFKPLYILGGLGGAAEMLAEAILATTPEMMQRNTVEGLIEFWKENMPAAELGFERPAFSLPADAGFAAPQDLWRRLANFVLMARIDPSAALNDGLSGEDTRELMKTSDVARIVALTRKGLAAALVLPDLVA